MSDGFDWLNVQPPNGRVANSADNSRNASPAPHVSFGNFSDLTLSTHSSVGNNALYHNLADNVLNRPSLSPENYTTSQIPPANSPTPDTSDPSSIPLSLTSQDLTLQESRTYIRWYSDILARTNSRTICMADVYNFLVNFKLSPELKDSLNKLFHKILDSINIGEFFALLRVISHCLNGQNPSRNLVRTAAPIPTPPSILSKKRQNDHDDEEENEPVEPIADPQPAGQPLDLDSFTQFMLTGERPDDKPRKRKKKLKSVKFSDQIVTDIHDDTFQSSSPAPSPHNELDFSLPMDQLLSRMSSNNSQPKDEEEQEILKDMSPQLNHFQNLNSVDTASIGGVPASIHLNNGSNNHSTDQLLKPNMTGPAQMSQYLQHHPEQDVPLKPNRTGPYDMMKMFSPSPEDQQQPPQEPPQPTNPVSPQPQHNQEIPKISLQTFTNQMTGNTASNTMANSQAGYYADKPVPPPPVPASRRHRSMSSPTPHIDHGASPVPPISRARSPNSPVKPVPPPPPPSRRRGASGSSFSPQPPMLPPKVPEPPSNGMYSNLSDSTSNILDDLKELQAEVDRIRDMTGGF